MWSMNVTQSCLTLCDPMNYSLPGPTVHEILHSRIIEWVAIPFSRGSSQPRDWTWVSCFAGRFFTVWVTREALQVLVNLAPHFSVEEPESDLPRLTPEAGIRAGLDSWFPSRPPTRLSIADSGLTSFLCQGLWYQWGSGDQGCPQLPAGAYWRRPALPHSPLVHSGSHTLIVSSFCPMDNFSSNWKQRPETPS